MREFTSSNVARRLAEFAQANSSGAAVIVQKRGVIFPNPVYSSTTFAELAADSDAISRGLQAYGVTPGMRLALLVKPMGIAVTRIASGLPVGGDLEYADEITLGRAFEGRRSVDV